MSPPACLRVWRRPLSAGFIAAWLLASALVHPCWGNDSTSAPKPAEKPGSTPPTPASSIAAPPRYESRPASRGGTGKFYLGREIAQVMGHEGADWLERPERQQEERTDLLLPALKLKPGDVVADVGAGTGYFSWRLAEAVGPRGRVYAVDIQPEMIDLLQRSMTARGVTNVVPILGTLTDPRLPTEAVDLLLMVDVYHEFSHPHEMLVALVGALKPQGRLVFVEYRGEDDAVPIKPLHKMTEAQVRREAEAHSLVWQETLRSLPWQHAIVFQKQTPAGSR